MSTATSVIHPIHFQIVERKNADWYFKNGTPFYNPTSKPLPTADVERLFGITKNKIVIELFRINGGKPGYYLANLKDKKYYYCGADWSDVKKKLLDLGIGRADPLERRDNG